ncbi:hypothetical protein PtA15_17A107 [Puccinia triticina]|uniref:RGS domain-containing protein n=1 Tax=Puccinia triticina TaxID=208348 RepID=A0ABY7D6Y1_9BASI|nr:uncharacterized protein PtA15_17A107 [Puccinia triticina]WAQ92625.1 hypothetical protein PtA15_17A107 [Puccinia triticina]
MPGPQASNYAPKQVSLVVVTVATRYGLYSTHFPSLLQQLIGQYAAVNPVPTEGISLPEEQPAHLAESRDVISAGSHGGLNVQSSYPPILTLPPHIDLEMGCHFTVPKGRTEHRAMTPKAAISNSHNDILGVQKNSKTLAFTIAKESPEEYIERVLNPIKSTRFQRTSAELPESEQEGEILIKQIMQEFRSLRENVKSMGSASIRAMVQPYHSQVQHSVFVPSRYASKLDEIHQKVAILKDNRLATLKGRFPTISILSNNYSPPATDILIQPKSAETDGAKIVLGEAERQSRDPADIASSSRPAVNYEEHSKMPPDEDPSKQASARRPEEPALGGDSHRIIMQLIGKDVAEETMDLVKKSSPNQEQHVDCDISVHRLGFQTIHFMHRNHLIDHHSFSSLFTKVILDEAAENMFRSYIYDQPYLFGKSYIEDCKNVFNGWYASPDREMFSVLEPRKQRMFLFYSVKQIFNRYKKLPESAKAPLLLQHSMDLYYHHIFKKQSVFNLLEEVSPRSTHESEELETLKNRLRNRCYVLRSIEDFDPNEQYQNEVSVVFQAVRFFKENYPDLKLIEQGEEFEKKYALWYECSRLHGRLDNIRIYLEFRFAGKHPSPMGVEFLPPANTSDSPFTPQDKLALISTHVDLLFAEHDRAIQRILDGAQKNRYCDHIRVSDRVIALKNRIIELRSESAS